MSTSSLNSLLSMKRVKYRRAARAIRAAGLPIWNGRITANYDGNLAPAWVVEVADEAWRFVRAMELPRSCYAGVVKLFAGFHVRQVLPLLTTTAAPPTPPTP